MNPVLIQWGPALLILFGIVLGVIYNNRSINHLDTRISGEIGHLSTRISEEIGHLNTRISGEIGHLDHRISGEIGRLDTRISGEIGRVDTRITGEIGHLSTRIDDLIRGQELRHTDLKDFIKSEVRRLEDRIDRIEHPVIRS
jgi:hypothetical protein